MSNPTDKTTNIKRMEKRKGRFWGFMKKEDPGIVTPLPLEQTTQRLRQLMMSSMKSIGAFLRNTIGEGGMTDMFEFQAEEFATESKKPQLSADTIARDMIKYNFQPFGIEATYTGDKKSAKILVKTCPLPQRLLNPPEFFRQYSFDQKPLLSDFGGETLTARGEWPPKKVESCYLCRIVMPAIGEKLGFSWEYGLTDDTYRKCQFTIQA